MHHSILTQHTKSNHRPLSLSVSSGGLLVAINKTLNESHGVNGAPASNNVISRKLYRFIRFTHTSWQCLRSTEPFFLYVIYTEDPFDTTPCPSHCRLPVNYTIHLRSQRTIHFISFLPCFLHHSSQPSTLLRLKHLHIPLWLRHGWRSCQVD